jgi:hypothetical protein
MIGEAFTRRPMAIGTVDEMVSFFVAAGIIHQDHAGDGETAKNV